MSKPLIHLFLSAPGSNRPYYKRDILNLCCFAVEDKLDFAFRKKWIASDILSQIEGDDDCHKLEGQKALLIFCELNVAINGDNIFTFHPIRFATILRTIDRGGSITFETKLGGFVDLVENAHTLILDSTDQHPNHARVDGKASEKARFVRYASNHTFKTTGSTTEMWNSLADRLISLRGLSDSLFLVASDKFAKNYPQFPLKSSWDNSVLHNVAKVKRGDVVSLTLYGVPGKESKQFSVPNVTVSDAVARVSGPYIRQYANGYLMRYFLQTKSGWDSDSAMLRITLEDANKETGTMDFRSPEIAVHLQVHPRWGTLFGVVFLFSLGTLLSTFDKDSITFFLSSINDIDKIANFLVLGLKFVGSVCIGAGAFIAFRKLPGPGGK